MTQDRNTVARIGSGALAMLIALAPTIGAGDPVDVANAIRSEGCRRMAAVDQPLRKQAALDEAARRMAEGASLKSATAQSGYRARVSASIHVRSRTGGEDITKVIKRRFCDIVADPGLHEIGMFHHGHETWMVLATPMIFPAAEDSASIGRQVLDLINAARAERRRCGRKKFAATTPLSRSAELERAALVHAQDIASRGYLGHEGHDGSAAADRATRAGYAWAAVAENVAAGQSTGAEVVATWLASAGHCANLMSARYTEAGLAYAVNPEDDLGIYWVQVYAAPE